MEMINKLYDMNKTKRYVDVVFGMLLCALSYNLFLLPNNIVFGGVSGLSIIAGKYFNIIPAFFILGCSLFIAIFSYFLLGKDTTFRALVGSTFYSLFTFFTSGLVNYINIPNNDTLLVSIFGGVLYGLGLGLVMKGGFTAGGTDSITNIVSKYLGLTTGTSMIIVEGIIILIGSFVFGIANLLYAVIILFLITVLVDKVMLGISDKKAFYIITKEKKKVTNYVINEMGHTITVFSATGGFTKKKQSVLFTVIPTREYYKLKEGIKLIDREVFFTAIDAYEVLGGKWWILKNILNYFFIYFC